MRSNGFILSEQMLALGIVIVGLSFFAMSMGALRQGRVQMEERLIATRLCRERLYSGQAAVPPGYRLRKTAQRVEVFHNQRKVLEIQSVW